MPEFDSTIRYANVAGFPGYKVGTDGSVWSCRRPGPRPGLTDKWKRLRPIRGSTAGHCSVLLCPGSHQRLIHRLVLEAFVGPCPEGMEACHFPDRDPANCTLTNLRWATHAENMADMAIHGTRLRGEEIASAKLTADEIVAIRILGHEGFRAAVIAERFHVSRRTISHILNGYSWRHVLQE